MLPQPADLLLWCCESHQNNNSILFRSFALLWQLARQNHRSVVREHGCVFCQCSEDFCRLQQTERNLLGIHTQGIKLVILICGDFNEIFMQYILWDCTTL